MTGHRLTSEGTGPAWLCHDALFVLLAHDIADDPAFLYGNKATPARLGYSWEKLTSPPSRLSPEAPGRAERQTLLDAVTRGVVADYRCVRIKKSRPCFRMDGGIIWQLIDEDGQMRGQAAQFSTRENLA